MARPSNKRDSENYIRDRLQQGDISTQADIGAYLSALKNLYGEYQYMPPLNPLIIDYVKQNTGAETGLIDLTDSGTSLSPREPAVHAAKAAVEAKENELYGLYRSLSAEAEAMASAGNMLDEVQKEFSGYSSRDLNNIPANVILQVLVSVLAAMKPKEIEIVKAAYERELKLDPVLKECIDHCTDSDYNVHLPADRNAAHQMKLAAVKLTLMACDDLLNGTYTHSEGLVKKFARIKEDVRAEKARLPDKAQLAKQAEIINDSQVRPAIMKMMQQLNAVPEKEIKPKNLCLSDGSSSRIMRAALNTLVVQPKDKELKQKGKKKLILFSASWDGLKTIVADEHLDISLVNGPVNAQALEKHIQQHILQGRFADDADKAKAEVKKQLGGILMNIPENPTGHILSDKEMTALAEVIKKYDIPVVLLDEIFAAPGHRSLLTYPDMRDRCYMISSTSKNISLENKLAFGYSANDRFASRVKTEIESHHKFENPMLSISYAAFLKETPAAYYERNQRIYAHKRQVVSEAMENVNQKLKLTKGLDWLQKPDYGCLGVISLPRELTDNCGIKNSCQLAEYIFKFGGLMTVPIGDVQPDPAKPLGVRINFSEEDHRLTEAMDRVGVAIQHMQKKKPYKDIQGAKYRGNHLQGSSSGLLGTITDMISSMFTRDQRGGITW